MVASSDIILIAFVCSFNGVLSAKYIFFEQKATWYEAKSICQNHGHMLAKVDSADDQQLINDSQIWKKGNIWIGLQRMRSEENFTIWVDSSPLQYDNWAEGFPGHDPGFNCGRVIPEDNTWESAECSTQETFLCQRTVYHPPNIVTLETKIKGLLLGAFLVGGMVVFLCLLLQMTCCRIRALDRIKQNLNHETDKTPII